jgi:arylsulfatase A-like enzyme
MKTELLIQAPTKREITIASRRQPTQLRSGLILLSVVALFCLSAEAELIEQIDSLSLYMTYGEIALDAGVALIILLSVASLWWLFVMALVKVAHLATATKPYGVRLGWYLGLGVPLAYLFLDIFGSVKAQIFPTWHSGLLVWILACAACLACIFMVDLSRLQEFCRTRLVPIAWVHIALVVIAATGLGFKSVHRFHNYVGQGSTTAISNLPDVYLITADALGAEDMSLYGYSRPTTPNLGRFAERSFTFDYCFANSNFTAPSTTSIETGKLPWSHRIFQQGGFLRGKSQAQTLAALMRKRGYYTAMIAANQWADPFRHRTQENYDAVEFDEPVGMSGAWFRLTNLSGLNTQYTLVGALFKRFGRAMTYVDAIIWPRRYPAQAEHIFHRARALLERPDISQPRFLWAHILPPHDPYLPPLPYRGRFLPGDRLTRAYDFLTLRNYALPTGISADEVRARYDEMVLYADAAIGDFIDWLDRTGRLDHAIVIVTADHGESFEHHWFLHSGPPLYDALIQIPLLIHLPGQVHGSRISQPAQQVDLLPTILDLIGAPAAGWTDGASLKPELEGKIPPDRLVFSMNLEPDRVFGSISNGTLSVIDNEFKYVIRLNSHEESLYRYKIDRLEDHNLISSEPDIAKRLRNVLLARLVHVNEQYVGRP